MKVSQSRIIALFLIAISCSYITSEPVKYSKKPLRGKNQVEVNGLLDDSKTEFVFRKVYSYKTSILASGTNWQPIPFYNVKINVPSQTNELEVLYNIPFTMNNSKDRRNRVRLLFDGIDIGGWMAYDPLEWGGDDIKIRGRVYNVKPGPHRIQLMARVDGGVLNIPHLNRDHLEFTKGALTGELTIVGHLKKHIFE